jgi:lipopolysaccharide biosynthesis glycosyltransferase
LSPAAPEPLRIACAVEGEAYVKHCAAMLHSVLAQHPEGDVRIEYTHGEDTSARGRRRLARMISELGGEITFHNVPDDWLDGLPVKGFTRKATWYRAFLPDLLDGDRVLYLDLDLLAAASLLPLWETGLDDWLLGAVTNVLPPADRHHAERLGLPDERSYFNAGVLLMNLDAMRRERTRERIRSYAIENAARLNLRDQDALNFVLYDRRLPLHPRWNCMNAVLYYPHAEALLGHEALAEARARPAIRHFEGPGYAKAWHLLSEPTSRKMYSEHRRQTPWPWVIPSGCTARNLLRYASRRRSRGGAR